MTSSIKANEICCPEFDPTQWNEKSLEWTNKKFIKESVATFFYMPLNFGSKMKKLDKKVSDVGAAISDNLCLSNHTSKWNMDLYLAVENEIPGTENTTFTGKFYSKVYEGPFRDTGKWSKDYESIVKSKGQKVLKSFMWYTTCPKCAKKYGKNYVVIIAKVE